MSLMFLDYNASMIFSTNQKWNRWLFFILLSFLGCASPPPESKPSKPGQTVMTISKQDYSLNEKIECNVEMTAMNDEAMPALVSVEIKKKSTTYAHKAERPQNITKLIGPNGLRATFSLSFETTALRGPGNFTIQSTSLYYLEPGTPGTSHEPNEEGMVRIKSKAIPVTIKKAQEQPRR